MIRIAEVDFDSEKFLKFFVMPKQNVVVSREAFHFRIALQNSQKCFVNLMNADDKYEFKK
jgi:hypothetical protein